MSYPRRLILVATDHRLGQAVQTHLHKTFLLTAPVVRPDDVAELVTRETDGILLLLASDPQDADRLARVVRDVKLQQLPARLASIETGRQLDPVGSHLEARFAWSNDLKDFNSWVRRAVTPGVPFTDPNAETTPDRLRRKLLTLTPSLTHFIEQLEIAAAHDVTVLIEGETGTGKTHLARLIHECSARTANRFLVVPCGALSANLIASEFFGHARGSFTGADVAKVGKFAAAGQGTILLDEIDTLGLDHQTNLLRVIETGEYEPVGSNETQVCQARIIAATNWNLADAVERGTFRRDLYYRLHVITFHLPPLRSRTLDIGPLVRGMAARYAARFNKKIYAIDPEAMRALEMYPWPGNIRQLENVVQQAVLTCNEETLRTVNLPMAVQSRSDPTADTPPPASATSLAHNREATERAAIVRALEKVGHSRTRAAELFGVSRVTLYKKMKKYGLLSRPSVFPNSPLDLTGSRFGV